MSTVRLLPSENIKIVDKQMDWKEAISLAAKPLLENNNISQVYVDNMIESVEVNGPYMVLNDYFALLHAKPGVGVNEQGMSLMVTKDEIDMLGKPIKIFLVLAAENSDSHLKNLQKLMDIFMNEQNYQDILKGDKKRINKIFG